MPPDYIEISGHPSNQKLMQNIGQNFDDKNSLIVLDLSNSRRKKDNAFRNRSYSNNGTFK